MDKCYYCTVLSDATGLCYCSSSRPICPYLSAGTKTNARPRGIENLVAVINKLSSISSNINEVKNMDKDRILQKLLVIEEAVNQIRSHLDAGGSTFPIPEEQLVWSGGNLWKPEADPNSSTPGKLVVVLRADWPVPDSVQVLLRDGVSYETLTSGGFLEDGRMSFRARFPGGEAYAGKRQGGHVRIFYGDDFGVILLKKAPKFRQE